MLSIKDVDEKKLIINYYKLGTKRNRTKKNTQKIICNSNVYAEWIQRWRDDFAIDGKCLKMFGQKFVVSAAKYKKGIKAPEYYKEYNNFICSITNFMIANYDKNIGIKRNRKKIGDILVEYRKDCADRLLNILNDSKNLSNCELVYTLPDKADKLFMSLVKYSIVHNGLVIFSGSYDEVKEYISKIDDFIGEKINE